MTGAPFGSRRGWTHLMTCSAQDLRLLPLRTERGQVRRAVVEFARPTLRALEGDLDIRSVTTNGFVKGSL